VDNNQKNYYINDDLKIKLSKDRTKTFVFVGLSSLVSLILGVFITINLMKDFTVDTQDDPNMAKFLQIYETIKDEWYFGDEVTNEESYIDRALASMVNEQNVDNYLHYYSIPEPVDPVTNPIKYGIGVSIAQYDGYLMIDEVYSNSPAEKAGLIIGDLITAVDGISIRYKTTSDISELIQGDYKTDVTITVLRESVQREFIVTRDVWKQDSVFGYDYGNYAVLKITGFDDNTSITADAILSSLTSSSRTTKVEDLVIDLRDNPGGYVMVFTKLADLFTPKDTVFGTYKFKNEEDSYTVRASSAQKYSFSKIIILVNGNSASASESFTASLKDSLENVSVVGETTYGKGIAQKTVSFEDGSSFKYTYAEFIRSNGQKLHQIGVTPDVVIKEEGAYTIWDKEYSTGETFENRVLEYLKELGYIGDTYVDILKDYQSKQGISITGGYDLATQGKINKDLYIQRKDGKENQLLKAISLLGSDISE